MSSMPPQTARARRRWLRVVVIAAIGFLVIGGWLWRGRERDRQSRRNLTVVSRIDGTPIRFFDDGRRLLGAQWGEVSDLWQFQVFDAETGRSIGRLRGAWPHAVSAPLADGRLLYGAAPPPFPSMKGFEAAEVRVWSPGSDRMVAKLALPAADVDARFGPPDPRATDARLTAEQTTYSRVYAFENSGESVTARLVTMHRLPNRTGRLLLTDLVLDAESLDELDRRTEETTQEAVSLPEPSVWDTGSVATIQDRLSDVGIPPQLRSLPESDAAWAGPFARSGDTVAAAWRTSPRPVRLFGHTVAKRGVDGVRVWRRVDGRWRTLAEVVRQGTSRGGSTAMGLTFATHRVCLSGDGRRLAARREDTGTTVYDIGPE